VIVPRSVDPIAAEEARSTTMPHARIPLAAAAEGAF
jgi:hypothetical protein